MNNLASSTYPKSCLQIILILTVLFQTFLIPVKGQTSSQDGCQECTSEKSKTWSQNSTITVNLNADQFSDGDRQCVQGVIDSLNAQSSALGNGSGVHFNLVRSTTAYVSFSVNDAGQGSINANGNSNVLQINRPPISAYLDPNSYAPSPLDISTEFGTTAFTPSSGLNATAAMTFLNPNITSCEALKFNILHEMAHTMGLDDCPDYNPPANQSVMYRPNCLNLTNGCTPQDFNFVPSDALTTLSNCDNQKIKDVGQYDPNIGTPPSGNGDNNGNSPPYYCTPYYWVYYESWDDEQTWEIVDVSYAGCW